jgi:Protein of unknown function (DUF2630)
MTDEEILTQIHALVDEEHKLRERHAAGELSPEEEQKRVERLEVALDQCWDLLRQRRARKDAGEDPGLAQPRPAGEVEGYLQ